MLCIGASFIFFAFLFCLLCAYQVMGVFVGQLFLFRLIFIYLFLTFTSLLSANDDICAVVSIQIQQEATVERQGFKATLEIENVLKDQSLHDISIDITFKNRQGDTVVATTSTNNDEALFFIREISSHGVELMNNKESIPAESTAIKQWHIIPAPGAAEGKLSGALYWVSARLHYSLHDEGNTLEGKKGFADVRPDHILVKPMPDLAFDYFLPQYTHSDNPFTDIVEPAEPFPLCVRVMNNGVGTAKNLSINSAQPTIVANQQGLDVDFAIIEGYVNDVSSDSHLLLTLGDVAPKHNVFACWIMQTSLTGEFDGFNATFTHAAELGGQTTSLISSLNTHRLIHRVQLDSPNDQVLDALTYDGLTYSVYASHSSSHTSTALSVQHMILNEPVNKGVLQSGQLLSADAVPTDTDYMVYEAPIPSSLGHTLTQRMSDIHLHSLFSQPDPWSIETHPLYQAVVTRQDGKMIDSNNVWIDKTLNNDNVTYSYTLRIFDHIAFGSTISDSKPIDYHVQFIENHQSNQAPILSRSPLLITYPNTPVSVFISADDLDPIAFSIPDLMKEAAFSSTADNEIRVDWIPTHADLGRHRFTVLVTDGELHSSRHYFIEVRSSLDTDDDGLNDDWEREHFGDLEQNSSDDADNDGMNNGDEFLNGSSPILANGPPPPSLVYPHQMTLRDLSDPTFIIKNSPYEFNLDIHYEYEVSLVEDFSTLVNQFYYVTEGDNDTTLWQPDMSYSDQTAYYWRVRAHNKTLASEWRYGYFVTDTQAIAPESAVHLSPENKATVTISPILSVLPSAPTEGQWFNLQHNIYQFNLYDSENSEAPILQSEWLTSINNSHDAIQWQPNIETQNTAESTSYWWNVTVKNNADLVSHSDNTMFTIEPTVLLPHPIAIVYPPKEAELEKASSLQVTLDLRNVSDTAFIDYDKFDYVIELDIQPNFDSQNVETVTLTSTEPYVSWTLPSSLDDALYYVRVKSVTPSGDSSLWVHSSFTLNQINNTPTTPTVKNPGNDSWVDTLLPTLSINESYDQDGDELLYHYEIYIDDNVVSDGITLVQEYTSQSHSINLTTPLLNDTWYSWRFSASDEHGLMSEWSDPSRFYVSEEESYDVPQLSFLGIQSTRIINPGHANMMIEWEDSDSDSHATIKLIVSPVDEALPDIVIAEDIQEDLDGEYDQFSWDTSTLPVGYYHVKAYIYDDHHNIEVIAPYMIHVTWNYGTPGDVVFTPNQYYNLQENALNRSIHVSLSKKPSAPVHMQLDNQSDHVSISPSSMVFTPDNWDQPQPLTLLPIQDCLYDWYQPIHIMPKVHQSNEALYPVKSYSAFQGQVINDEPDFSVSPLIDVCDFIVDTITENQNEFTHLYYVKIRSAHNFPLQDIVLNLSPRESHLHIHNPSLSIDDLQPNEVKVIALPLHVSSPNQALLKASQFNWEVSQ
ncbi:hypothetical protein N9R79_11765 [Vibrio sp.]|nr:hypothetical protein [Vibrio sp.]